MRIEILIATASVMGLIEVRGFCVSREISRLQDGRATQRRPPVLNGSFAFL